MPYPSEHAARIREPGQFDEFRRSADEFGEGRDAIFGTNEDGTELQSIRFDAERHSEQAARDWLEANDYEPIKFSPATNEEGEAMCAFCAGSGEAYDVTTGEGPICPSCNGEGFHMSDIIKCTVDGDEVADLNAAAGLALERDSGVKLTASIYRPERVKLYSAPRLNAAGMAAVASTLRGSPVNYEHRPISDADPVQGWIRASWVEDGAIHSELEITGSRALSELAANAEPGFSIEYTYNREDVTCGSCGTAWFDTEADCACIPGQMVEGSVVYCETSKGIGAGVAWTHRPAAEGTGIVARASTTDGTVDIMEPALARLALTEKGNMSDEIEMTEADAVPVEATTAEATADRNLSDRLAAAEAENSLLREKVAAVEAAQFKAEANARASANREQCLRLAREGQVANVRELILLRGKTPAELSTFEDVEAFVDQVVACCAGTGIPVGQLSESAILGDTPPIRNDKDLENRAVQLSAERNIPYSHARRLAVREVK